MLSIGSRARKLLLDALTIVLIAGAMIFILEAILRAAFSQRLTTSYSQGHTLGLKDPVLGHVNNPGARVTQSGPEFEVTYVISEQGFRSEAVHQADAAEGTTRILLLGDSFTFGASNAYEDIWPVLLSQRFAAAGRKIEIINAGVPAYDTTREILYLERLYEAFKPDIVLIGFLTNDLFTNLQIGRLGDPETVRLRDVEIVAKGNEKKSSLELLTLLRRVLMNNDVLYKNIYLMTARREYFSNPPSEPLSRQIQVTKDLLARAAAFCRERQVKLIVLSIPQLFQVIFSARRSEISSVDVGYADRTLSAFAESENFAWIATLEELATRYATTHEDLYFRFDGHLNKAGNAAVADVAYERLLPLLAKR